MLPGAIARLDTDLLGLFPELERDPAIARATERITALGQNRIMLVVRVADREGAPARLGVASARLDALVAGSDGLLEAEAGTSGWSGRALYDSRFLLVTPGRLERLTADPDATIQDALRATLGPGGLRAAQLAGDPLGLHAAYLAGLLPPGLDPAGGALARDGWLNALHPVRTGAGAFDLTRDERLSAWLDAARREIGGLDAELLATGLPVFAADGAMRAGAEISTFGTLSLATIVVLMIATFASVRPLVMGLIVTGTGVAAGFAATAAIFGQVHVLTLVFGSSLIGIAIDYALHYLCEAYREPASPPAVALHHVLPGITIAMLTSAVAFLSFLATPFPGLRQIAVFAACGLAAAWLTVVAVAPWFPAPRGHVKAALAVAAAYCGAWARVPRRGRIAVAVLAVAFAAVGIARLSADDDVRALQSAPPHLLAEDRLVRALLPVALDSTFLVVQGADPATVLARERQVADWLDAAVAAGRLDGYLALSRHFPDAQAQRAAREAIDETFHASGRLRAMFLALGLDATDYDRYLARFEASPTETVAFADWLERLPEPWQALWAGCGHGECATVVQLSGIRAPRSTRAELQGLEGVAVVDPAGDLSVLLGRYRQIAGMLLVAGSQ